MDHPEPWMPEIRREFGRLPWLSYKGHRKRGHDALSAIVMGYMKGGQQGVVAALAHLAEDAGRDQIVNKYGEDAADVVEALGNLVYDLYKKKDKGRRKNGR